MANKKFVYFVSLSSNVHYVLKEALRRIDQKDEAMIFFDLNGARVLDKRYVKNLDRTHNSDLAALIYSALQAGISLYGCQLNVLLADGLDLVEGVESAGVVTFLEFAYQADAVLSY